MPVVGLLHEAAQRGEWVEIERLARLGADVHEYDEDDQTPLIHAAINGHVVAIRTLLKLGADPDLKDGGEGQSPIAHAASYRHSSAVLALLADGNRARAAQALVLAANYGLVPVAETLLRWGIPPNGEDGRSDALTAAAGRGVHAEGDERLRIARMLLASGAKPNPDAMVWAGRSKDPAMVRLLAGNGVPLTLAAAAAIGDHASIRTIAPTSSREEVSDAVRVAIALGEDEALGELLKLDSDLTQAAIVAMDGERYDILQRLLDAGLDPSARTPDSGTILFYAASRGRPEPVSILISAGTDVNAKTWNGHTALYRSVLVQRTEVVRLLLAAGADPNVVIPGMGTPLTVAAGRNYSEIAALLRNAGGTMKNG